MIVSDAKSEAVGSEAIKVSMLNTTSMECTLKRQQEKRISNQLGRLNCYTTAVQYSFATARTIVGTLCQGPCGLLETQDLRSFVRLGCEPVHRAK